jgi:hypothetical protein
LGGLDAWRICGVGATEDLEAALSLWFLDR